MYVVYACNLLKSESTSKTDMEFVEMMHMYESDESLTFDGG